MLLPVPEAQPSVVADDASMFELAPVSLWLEDASAVKTLFQSWQAEGMTSLRDRLMQPEYMAACLSSLKILKVNRKTLELFEVADFPDLLANLPLIITTDSMGCVIEEWVQLWEGKTSFFGKSINMTTTGRVLDVQIRGNLLPGYEVSWGRILVTIEDVTDLENARRAAASSEAYARGLFEHSPVSLWVNDFSDVKRLLDGVRNAGVIDLRRYFDDRPAFAAQCLKAIRSVDVNVQTMRLFGAKDKDSLTANFRDTIYRSDQEDVKTQIVGLWNGELLQRRDVVNHTLDGRDVHAQIQLSVLPGHETDWAKVQVARIDISERKKAEEYLKYVGSHDAGTNLYNRSYFIERMMELEAEALDPVTIIMIDLNGLKRVNDNFGHAAGDDLLRRASHILADLATNPLCAARIGGDEFVILMPDADEADGDAMIRAIERNTELHNQTTLDHPLSFSLGAATGRRGERLETVASRADAAMYRAKKSFYITQAADRRADAGDVLGHHA